MATNQDAGLYFQKEYDWSLGAPPQFFFLLTVFDKFTPSILSQINCHLRKEKYIPKRKKSMCGVVSIRFFVLLLCCGGYFRLV